MGLFIFNKYKKLSHLISITVNIDRYNPYEIKPVWGPQ